jgi:hypothetical protein
MTASPRTRGTTSFLRSRIRRRIGDVRAETGRGKVQRADLVQRSAPTPTTRQATNLEVVNAFPEERSSVVRSTRTRGGKVRQIPLLLLGIVKRETP